MQLRHLAERGSHRYNRILKSRQFGFTTLYSIDYLDEALWVPGMSCGILAHEQKYNEKIFSIVKRAFDNLPEEIKPVTKTNTKYAYDFVSRFDGDPLDSSIYVATDVRSGTVLKLHVTETAWLKDPAKVASGAKQAVPKNGCITEETTANGFNDFYDQYTQAEEIESKGFVSDYDYKTYFYGWWENPEYALPGEMPEIKPEDRALYGNEEEERVKWHLSDGQLLWRRWKINELRQSQKEDGITLDGLQLFKQEYPASRQEAFQSGAGNIFDVSGLSPTLPLGKDASTDTAYNALYQLGVKVWVLPQVGHTYVIGVDPSDGTGGDFADIDVWDEQTLEQVAQYHSNNTRPDILADISAQIGNFYNHAFIGVENNMLTCILYLVKIYDNYFTEVRIDKKTKERTKILGFSTNTKTRDPMIDDFRIAHEEGTLIIHSPVTLSEMKTFVKKEGGKREHADGKNDDSLFGAFIALQMRKLKPTQARVFTSSPW